MNTSTESGVSTVWIAEITGKVHRNVMRDIKQHLKGIDIYKSTYLSKQNKKIPCYILPKAMAAVVMARYDSGIVMKIATAAEQSIDIMKALQSFEIPDELPDMYVYAIRECSTGNIKLGISKDPEARVKQLQNGNSGALELVAYKRAVNRFKDEASLHELASDNNIKGEWFSKDALPTLLNFDK